MGSYSLLQIVGSTIVGGLVLLMLFRFNTIMFEKKHSYNTQNILQSNLTVASNLISLDLNKIGYCENKIQAVEIFKDPIVEATDSTFAFKTDVPVSEQNPFGDGVVDIVKYYLGHSIPSTPSTRDKIFYRKINASAPSELNYGVTKLKFKYYDTAGTLLPSTPADLKQIAVIEYTITIEDIYGFSYTYAVPDSGSGTFQGESYFTELSKTRKVGIINLKKR
ncbi:MAG: hypothetical protein V3V16_13075 [Melioribacteraceae bacterium]